MEEVMLIITVVFLMIISLVWFKYTIDTKSTIKELKKDRDKYRILFFNKLSSEDKNRVIIGKDIYKEVKDNINTLVEDLKNTDFNNFDNIKDEVISALENIESYGVPNDTD
jgi:hypothetical protein